MKMSTDSKTRSFDSHASGCVKSEAICVLFLQKAKDALRSVFLYEIKKEKISSAI